MSVKGYIIITFLIALAALSLVVSVQNKAIKSANNNWARSENNYKASSRKNMAYQVSLEQMRASNDSLDKQLSDFAKRIKAKDSKIKSLMTIVEEGFKSDTINSTDTLFVENLKLDTIVGDEWIKHRLELKYPGEIIITDSIKNIKNIS